MRNNQSTEAQRSYIDALAAKLDTDTVKTIADQIARINSNSHWNTGDTLRSFTRRITKNAASRMIQELLTATAAK